MKKYSLIHEPWIRVIQIDGTEAVVSLKDCFLNAHLYKCLAGENAHQCHAMYRFLFAIAHTVISRYDTDGSKIEIADDGIFDALDATIRWDRYYKMGRFGEQTENNPFIQYFDKWDDRFYLIHDRYPFFQCNDAEHTNTEYPTNRLNGMTQESNNCISLKTAQKRDSIPFDEAARALIYEMAYGNCGFKPTPKLGWVSQIDFVYVIGKNLFETIMLNTVMVQEMGSLWSPDRPFWEEDPDAYWGQSEGRKDVVISNFAGLLTVPTRKIKLQWDADEEAVISYKIMEGTPMSSVNGELEPFAAWTQKEGQPKRFQSNLAVKQTWREFPKLFIGSDGKGVPEVITWIKELKTEGLIPSTIISVCVSSIQFKTMNSVVKAVYTDDLAFYTDLLAERKRGELRKIEKEVDVCEKIAGYIKTLINDLGKCENRAIDKRIVQCKIEQFYSGIDIAFRKWIATDRAIDDTAVEEWRSYIVKKAREFGESLVLQASDKAITGRMVSVGKKEVLYTAYGVFNRYLGYLKNVTLEGNVK